MYICRIYKYICCRCRTRWPRTAELICVTSSCPQSRQLYKYLHICICIYTYMSMYVYMYIYVEFINIDAARV